MILQKKSLVLWSLAPLRWERSVDGIAREDPRSIFVNGHLLTPSFKFSLRMSRLTHLPVSSFFHLQSDEELVSGIRQSIFSPTRLQRNAVWVGDRASSPSPNLTDRVESAASFTVVGVVVPGRLAEQGSDEATSSRTAVIYPSGPWSWRLYRLSEILL